MPLSRRTFRRSLRLIVPISLLAGILLAGAGVYRAEAKAPNSHQIVDLSEAVQDSRMAGGAIREIRRHLADDLDPAYVPLIRGLLLQAQINSDAPSAELLGSIDSLDLIMPATDTRRVFFMNAVAERLIERGEQLDRALALAERSNAMVPDNPQYQSVRALCLAILGRAHAANGNPRKAIALLNEALPATPDSQKVLYHLGRAQEQAGAKDEAISTYLRSLGVFAGNDTSAAAPLRALYRKQHGSLKGLDLRILETRKAARNAMALDANRYEREGPEWELPDFDNKPVPSSRFKGKVVVVDFWGSWCGPCRAELPHFQAAYEKYKDRGVEFIGINWERATSRSEHAKVAMEYMDRNRMTFPVVLDYDYETANAFAVQAFPTMFLLDRSGRIRYRNTGFNDKIGAIMEAQIEALLESGAN